MSAFVLALLLLASGSVCGNERPATPVIVAPVLKRHFNNTLSLIGTAQPRRRSQVASESAGIVVQLPVQGGSQVIAGQLLLGLQDQRLQAQLLEALAEVRLRRLEYQHSETLWRDEAIAEQQLLRDEYEFQRAKAKLDECETRLRGLSVRAPFTGHIVQIFAELGQWVERGGTISHLISIDTIRVHVDMPEHHVPKIAIGDSASLIFPALSNTPRSSRVVAVIAQGQGESRAFPVVLEVNNLHHRIRPSMTARVDFQLPSDELKILIHKDAIITGPHGSSVFIVHNEKAVRRALELGPAHGGYVAVSGNVAVGDLAVIRGNERLRNEQSVAIIRKEQ